MSLIPNSIIPERIPKSFAMLHLKDDEIEDLRDVSLADAMIEIRRRIKAKSDPLRAEIDAHYDELISSLHTSGSQPSSGTQPKAASDEAPTPDAPCDSVTWILEEQADEQRNVRRRQNDDTHARPDARVDSQFDAPQFLGKTPVKDTAFKILGF